MALVCDDAVSEAAASESKTPLMRCNKRLPALRSSDGGCGVAAAAAAEQVAEAADVSGVWGGTVPGIERESFRRDTTEAVSVLRAAATATEAAAAAATAAAVAAAAASATVGVEYVGVEEGGVVAAKMGGTSVAVVAIAAVVTGGGKKRPVAVAAVEVAHVSPPSPPPDAARVAGAE